MTKKGFSVILALFLTLFGGIIAGYFLSYSSNDSNSIAAEELSESVSEAEDEEPFVLAETQEKKASAINTEKYLLTLSDNKIFIYKIMSDGSMTEIEEKEVNTSALRREDCGELFKGIIFDTVTQAREVLEDYAN